MAEAQTRKRVTAQEGPQFDFLACEADIAIYGGAAGGGKTWALLMEAARHIGNGGYRAVLFRRTTPQITSPKGLWDKALEMYPGLKGVPRQSPTLRFDWKSGARIEFRHLQHEDTVLDWQGAEIDLIGYDELTHFAERQFWYMLSRNRSLSGVRPYVRATTNPAPGWVKNLIAAWVDPNHPDPAQSGEVRWFIRKDGEIVWVPKGFVDDEGIPAKSLTFIKADIYDNKILLAKDPGYLSNLKSQPIVDQERLLRGNWNVFEGAFFAEFSEHAHCETVEWTPQTLPKHWQCGGGLDWGVWFAVLFRSESR